MATDYNKMMSKKTGHIKASENAKKISNPQYGYLFITINMINYRIMQ